MPRTLAKIHDKAEGTFLIEEQDLIWLLDLAKETNVTICEKVAGIHTIEEKFRSQIDDIDATLQYISNS